MLDKRTRENIWLRLRFCYALKKSLRRAKKSWATTRLIWGNSTKPLTTAPVRQKQEVKEHGPVSWRRQHIKRDRQLRHLPWSLMRTQKPWKNIVSPPSSSSTVLWEIESHFHWRQTYLMLLLALHKKGLWGSCTRSLFFLPDSLLNMALGSIVEVSKTAFASLRICVPMVWWLLTSTTFVFSHIKYMYLE